MIALSTVSYLIREFIVWGGVFGAGVIVYIVQEDLDEAWHGHRTSWFYAAARSGLVLIMLAVAESVLRSTVAEIPWNRLLGEYLTGLGLALIGYTGIFVEYRRRRSRKE